MDASGFRGLGEAIALMFWVGVGAIICTVVLLVYVVWDYFSTPDLQREAIERGYALHCPSTGKFAWKGECE